MKSSPRLSFFKIICIKTCLYVLTFLLFSSSITKIFAQDSSPQFTQGIDTLVVYKNVPGVVTSARYSIRVRSAATNNMWIDVFAHNTYNRALELHDIPRSNGTFLAPVVQAYQKHTKGWSHVYGNIEMTDNQIVEVEIAAKNGFQIGGQDFFKAKVHPAQKASAATLVNGKIYFTISKPSQIYIDINGQMDDFNAAINGGTGQPIHAVSLFANPVLTKPSLTATTTKIIEPGTSLAVVNAINPASYTTLYFKPGVHDLGSGIKLYPGKNIYIPGDALVYGSFNNFGVPNGAFSTNGSNIKMYGYGTISGAKIPHYEYAYYYPSIIIPSDKVISIDNPINCKIIGIASVDGANHTVDINGTSNIMQWIKTISWRTNGDGLGGYTDAEDCFIRSHDDSSYLKANKKRCTIWKDANARLFFMATTPENTIDPIIIEDCDVLYARLRNNPGTNGGGFTSGGVPGQRNVNVIVRNIRFHDKLINMSVFKLESGNESSFDGILFQNISIAGMAPGNNQKILGTAASPWYGGIIFDNLTIGGTLVTPLNYMNYFTTNEFVGDIWYRMPEYYSVTAIAQPSQGTISVATTDTTRFAIRTTDQKYLERSLVKLTAQASPGYKFLNWTGAVTSNSNPLLIMMDSDKSVTANFEYIGFRALTLISSPNGTIESNPVGTDHTFNTTITVTAKPAIGYKFNNWIGDLQGTNISSPLLMDSNKTVEANFVKSNDFAVNYGGDQYQAADGTVYVQTPAVFSTTNTISNTNDPFLYQSEINGTNITLNYPIDNGDYEVVLKFAEISHNAIDRRTFNTSIEGSLVLSNFDIFAEAGARFKAIDKTFLTTVLDGSLTINMVRIKDRAKLSAIKISRKSGITPLFNQIPQYCFGETIPSLPLTSTNGIAGSWTPALNNMQTTTYTFIPNAGQNAKTTTLTIAIGETTTWNGAGWSNGVPTSTMKAIIDADFVAPADLTACSLEVNAGANVIFPSALNLTLQNEIAVAASSTLTLENNSNLVQINASTNTGNINYIRNTALRRPDQTFWSSPVANQNLLVFSPNTPANSFTVFSEPTNVFMQVSSAVPTNFAVAKGYNIGAPSNYPQIPAAAQTFVGNFTGTPNNGNFSTPVTFTAGQSNGYNLIGNPYPCSINATAFLTANVGSLYFKTNIAGNSTNSTLVNGLASNYAAMNFTGAVASAISQGINNMPNGYIQAAQGFMFLTTTNKNVVFTNAMRQANTAGQFFRSSQTAENNKIWLNLTDNNNVFSQTMIAYLPNTTTSFDDGYDATQINTAGNVLSSKIINSDFAIQSRGAFIVNDVVKLSLNINTAGSYTLSKDSTSGIFSSDQSFYLKDNLLGTVHNINNTPYNFVTTAGILANRFELVYQTSLSANTNVFKSDEIIVFEQNGLLTISATQNLKAIKIFDLQGRNIFDTNTINTNTLTLPSFLPHQQVLFVQITNHNNEVVVKKIIF